MFSLCSLTHAPQDHALPPAERLALSLAAAGPSITLAAACETAAFALGGLLTSMPAVRNFSLAAAAAVALDFGLQVRAGEVLGVGEGGEGGGQGGVRGGRRWGSGCMGRSMGREADTRSGELFLMLCACNYVARLSASSNCARRPILPFPPSLGSDATGQHAHFCCRCHTPAPELLPVPLLRLSPPPAPQVTVFAALLVLDVRRLQSRRLDCLPCIQLQPEQLQPGGSSASSSASRRRRRGGGSPYRPSTAMMMERHYGGTKDVLDEDELSYEQRQQQEYGSVTREDDRPPYIGPSSDGEVDEHSYWSLQRVLQVRVCVCACVRVRECLCVCASACCCTFRPSVTPAWAGLPQVCLPTNHHA